RSSKKTRIRSCSCGPALFLRVDSPSRRPTGAAHSGSRTPRMLRNSFSPYGLRSVRGIASAGDGSPRRQSIADFAYRAVVVVLIAAAIFSLAYFLWRGIHVLLQAFAGVLFAVLLHALADWLSRHTRLAYRWSLAVVLVSLALAAGGLGYLLWSRIS